MGSNIITNFNRTCLATRTPAESSGQFAAIQISKRDEPIRIKAITWGCQIPDATDRGNFAGQNIFLARNLPISLSSNFSTLAPINLQSGAELLWTSFAPGLSCQNHTTFSGGLILPAGDEYALVCVAPLIVAALNTTMYFQVSLNAELDKSSNNAISEWRMI